MSNDSKRIKEIIEEHGFMDDGDLYELAEIIIDECVKVINKNFVLYGNPNYDKWTDALQKHFYGDEL